jgi:sterol 3beta-glucosyltransferase
VFFLCTNHEFDIFPSFIHSHSLKVDLTVQLNSFVVALSSDDRPEGISSTGNPNIVTVRFVLDVLANMKRGSLKISRWGFLLIVPLLALFSFIWFLVSFLQLDRISNVREIWTTIPNITESFGWDGVRPLNVVFMTWGARGDHQPNIALGIELGRRGHNVTVLGLDKYRHFIERHEPLIHYAPLHDDYVWNLAEQFGASEGADFLELARAYTVNSSRQLISQYMTAGRDADALFGNHAATILLHHLTVAEALQKPLFFTTHDLTLPTGQYSFDLAESRVKNYGRLKNIVNHRLFSLIFGLFLTFGNCHWRTVRRELGLGAPWPFMELFSPRRLADFPVFYTADATLWPPPSDHPMHWYSTGYFVTQLDADGVPPSTAIIEAWLLERRHLGRELVYFGQGSFSHHDQAAFTDILIDACTTLGLDAVVLESTVDNRPELPSMILKVSDVHQDWLFPQCSVIVHHGGAGTASQCIRSGKPCLCIPSMPFQEIWGGRLEEYGAGSLLRPSDALHAWKTNRTNLLISAISRASTELSRERAAELGGQASRKSREAGVSSAAEKVELHLRALLSQRSAMHGTKRSLTEPDL